MFKILYLVSEDWYFCSHRLLLAKAVKDTGNEVVVLTQIRNHGNKITDEGLRLIPIIFPRSIRRPWRDLCAILNLIRIYRKEKPDLIHQVALKPVIYGSISALFTKKSEYNRNQPVVINTLTGLGYIFTSNNFSAHLLRLIVSPLLRLLLRRNNSHVILQNHDDMEMLQEKGLISLNHTSLIRGSGVDTDVFYPVEEPEGELLVTLASRMLFDKGIMEFVNAARKLKNDGVKARFILVGEADPENPSYIEKSWLEQWKIEGVIEWWGKSENMPVIIQRSHIICLPSYREGLPKILLEAAACGKPIVTTDVPGCREIVIDGENGFLVPPKNTDKLAKALEKLILNFTLRKSMGMKGRELVVNNFSSSQIIDETLALYNTVLSNQY